MPAARFSSARLVRRLGALELETEPLAAIRLSVLLIFFFGLLGLIAIRLFQTSVSNHASFLQLATDQQTGQVELAAARGQIYLTDDPDGKSQYAVAKNIDTYSVNLIPHEITDIQPLAAALEQFASLKAADVIAVYQPAKSSWYLPPLKHGLSEDDKNKLAALHLAGLFFNREPKRVYPEKQLAAQVLGYVNADGKGQYGVEGSYNDELVGRDGQQTGLKSESGGFISIAKAEPPRNGNDLTLTIDRNVQYVIEEKLKSAVDKFKADSGTVVVVEPKTGAIIAMAQVPTFDVNTYNQVPTDQQAVFRSQALSFPWEPGSIMKPLVVAAALDAGAVPKDFTGNYGASVTVQGHTIHTALNKAYGHENLSNILENSDNVAMVDVSNHLGNQKMYEAFQKFGFTGKAGIDIDGEVSGSVLPVKQWNDIARATMSFGQGMTTTPLQIVMDYAALANQGHLMKPYVIRSIRHADGSVDETKPTEVRQIVSADTTAALLDMLKNVVIRGEGHAAAVAGYTVAGKTGTAQIPSDKGGYEDGATIGSFAGFAPASNPRFVMLVKLDRPKNVQFAESSAAPTFSDIASFLLSYYRVPPDKL